MNTCAKSEMFLYAVTMAEAGDEIVMDIDNTYGYKTLHVKKSQVLGRGSYGRVVKATLDNLPCAAKLLHTEFFQHDDPGLKDFENRFVKECDILRELKNPFIVGYLGAVMDPHEHKPILLMELMEESLTHFLESAEEPLLYHTQVDIVSNIALALDYLHGKRIIHRDLSSNNILLNEGTQAKVTDFGMSKFVGDSTRMTQARITQCPGTQLYMSPEALRQITPRYSEKLDIFSLGVLMIQIVTRKFPAPTNPHTEKNDPTAPAGYVLVPIPELQRRHDDVSKVPHDHTFGPIFRQCIKDKEVDRPTAAHLCHQMKELKESKAYKTSEETKRRRMSGEPLKSQEGKEKKELARKVKIHKEDAATLRRKLKQKEQEEWRLQEENRRLVAEQRELAREKELKTEAEVKQEKEMEESLLQNMETTAAEVCYNDTIDECLTLASGSNTTCRVRCVKIHTKAFRSHERNALTQRFSVVTYLPI